MFAKYSIVLLIAVAASTANAQLFVHILAPLASYLQRVAPHIELPTPTTVGSETTSTEPTTLTNDINEDIGTKPPFVLENAVVPQQKIPEKFQKFFLKPITQKGPDATSGPPLGGLVGKINLGTADVDARESLNPSSSFRVDNEINGQTGPQGPSQLIPQFPPQQLGPQFPPQQFGPQGFLQQRGPQVPPQPPQGSSLGHLNPITQNLSPVISPRFFAQQQPPVPHPPVPQAPWLQQQPPQQQFPQFTNDPNQIRQQPRPNFDPRQQVPQNFFHDQQRNRPIAFPTVQQSRLDRPQISNGVQNQAPPRVIQPGPIRAAPETQTAPEGHWPSSTPKSDAIRQQTPADQTDTPSTTETTPITPKPTTPVLSPVISNVPPVIEHKVIDKNSRDFLKSARHLQFADDALQQPVQPRPRLLPSGQQLALQGQNPQPQVGAPNVGRS